MVSGIFSSPFSVSSFLKNGEKWRAKALNYPTGYPTKIRTAGPFIGQKKQAKIIKKKHAVFLTSKKRSAFFDKNSCYTLISTSFSSLDILYLHSCGWLPNGIDACSHIRGVLVDITLRGRELRVAHDFLYQGC